MVDRFINRRQLNFIYEIIVPNVASRLRDNVFTAFEWVLRPLCYHLGENYSVVCLKYTHRFSLKVTSFKSNI